MIMKTIKVSEKGQIAIPQSIRNNIGIKKGDEMVLVQTDGKILLQKAQKISTEVKEDFRDLLRFSELSLRSVWNNKKDDIWNNYLKK